jgi:hypothetical protein
MFFQLCRAIRFAARREREKVDFEGMMTVENSFEDMQSGMEVTIACRVQDDLGGEGMKVMKLRVE